MKKLREGVVVSDRMDKTRVVEVRRTKTHPLYRKEFQVRKRYKAHDPRNESHLGDRVIIEECRPLSRDKMWRLKSVVKPH